MALSTLCIASRGKSHNSYINNIINGKWQIVISSQQHLTSVVLKVQHCSCLYWGNWDKQIPLKNNSKVKLSLVNKTKYKLHFLQLAKNMTIFGVILFLAKNDKLNNIKYDQILIW